MTAGGSWCIGTGSVTSDQRLKEGIENIRSTEALKSVLKLRPVSFKRKDFDDGDLNHFGFIAQEVEDIIPEIVTKSEEPVTQGGEKGILGLKYESVIPFLCGAIQEQQKQIDELKKTIDELK